MQTDFQGHAPPSPARSRRLRWWCDLGGREPWDVLVIGGGVQGACAYHRLAAAGLSVLLVDRGDFAGATSQASAMLAWGGLLYLRNGEIAEVWRLCAARDELIRRYPHWVQPHRMRYVFGRPRGVSPAVFSAALTFYWLLGRCRRAMPRREPLFDEQAMLGAAGDSITFEEGRLCSSDAQFVLGWLNEEAGRADRQAINYAELVRARWEGSASVWRIELRDALDGREAELRARCVVNAAGVWADHVEERCDIASPWRHALSKGVSLSIPRHPCHRSTLLFDDVSRNQGYSLVPWGPVSLWGSTETWAGSIEEGFRPTTREVQDLLRVLNQHLASPIRPRDVLSLRCGIRPLAVRCSERASDLGDPLMLSRRAVVWRDRNRPWVKVCGGKLTGAPLVAERVWRAVRRMVSPSPVPSRPEKAPAPPVETEHLCGLEEPVPAAHWCREHTQCWTLEDYLRRRTNIAQWVPRGGLGRHGEHEADLLQVATILTEDAAAARRELDHYRCRVAADHDAVLTETSDAPFGQPGALEKELAHGKPQ